jgi:tetratricopeptide (TPR) repeat protein
MSAEASEPRPPASVRPLRSALRVRPSAFFLVFYLCTLFYIDPARIYYGYWLTMQFPMFKTGWEFLREHATEPGKLTEYAAAFVSQLYALPWLGALVVTAVAGLLCLGAWSCLVHLTGRRPTVAHYVPALLLLLPYNVYRNPMAAGLGLSVAVGCACVYAALRARPGWMRSLAFVALFGGCYYLAGGASLIFAWLCVVFAVAAERRPLTGAAYAALAAAVPYLVGKVILRLRITDAYFRLWFFHQDSDPLQGWFVAALYAFWIALPMWGLLWPWLRARPWWAAALTRMVSAAGPLGRLARGGVGRGALSVAPFALGVAVIGGSYNGDLRAVFQVEYCAQHQQWSKLLQTVRGHRWRHYTFFISWDVNRALGHLNQMSDRMFAYQQGVLGLVPNPTSFGAGEALQPVWIKLSDVLWELGRVNEAEHMAYEALEFTGDNPRIIRQLALIAVAKRETETARILLRALRQDLWNGRWAAEYLRRLEADPSGSFDDEIRRVRALRVDRDPVGWIPAADMLSQSLEKNPGNRMAFEYLMADCLLNRNLGLFAANISRLKDFSYPSIPRHYEEALLLYTKASPSEGYVYEHYISDETKRRYEGFVDAGRRSGLSAATAQALAKGFGDTYFYYYTFGKSGVGR